MFFIRKRVVDRRLFDMLTMLVMIGDGLYKEGHDRWLQLRETDCEKGREIFLTFSTSVNLIGNVTNKIRELIIDTGPYAPKSEYRRAMAILDYLDHHPVIQKLKERYVVCR